MESQIKKNNSIEILCIGTELLLGNILNSNAKWLAEELTSLGLNHYQQTVIGDNFNRLKNTILDISNRSRFLITTGGIGPTQDDITTQAIASAFNKKLVERDGIWEDIQKKINLSRKVVSSNNKKQAFFPSEAIIIPNKTGTAPGMIWSPIDNFTILTFPGVPSELKEMWAQSAVNWFKANMTKNEVFTSRVLKLTGVSESNLAEEIDDLIANKNPTVAPYASLGEVKLRLTAKAATLEEGQNLIQPIEKNICKRVGQKCYGFDNDTLSSVIIDILRQRKETLSVAESCTGGGLGAELTAIPGASDIFLGGVIAYNNSLKQKLLGVPKVFLEEHGAVSKNVVEHMAEAVRKLCGSDWGIAISGLAGPGGESKSKPVGLVQICISGPNLIESKAEIFNASKGRLAIQKLSVVCSLNRLRLILLARG